LIYRSFLIWCNSICQFLLLFSEFLESYSENCYLYPHLLVFSDSSFKVSDFTLRTLINCELIFVWGGRWESSLSLLCVDIQFFPTPFVEEALFSPMYNFDTFVENQMVVAVWTYLRVFSLSSCLFFMPVPSGFFLFVCFTMVYSIIWSCILWYLQHCSFLLRIALVIQNFLCFQWILGLIFLFSYSSDIGIFMGITLNL
jgi:hypothetical protein